jgi:lysophospholipid acyltransferase (LPLAT)-like uncharacterized protein
MRWPYQVVGWIAAMLLLLWRWSIRFSYINDPRPALRKQGKGAAIGFLHAHQIAGVMGVDDSHVRVMVSQSRDGDLLTPSLRCRGISYARGSTRKNGVDKGGRAALAKLAECVAESGFGLLAVDGPQGPRNIAQRGVAILAVEFDVPILPVIIVPSRRLILSRTWDRMQIPLPFTRITFHWGEPILPDGRSIEELRALTADALRELERQQDPAEAALCHGQGDPEVLVA